jgi:TPR repeat protein
MVDLGDISAARRFYERAAAAGNGRAAAAAGRTYDPAFLAGIRAGIQADPEAASAWYRRAAALGEGAARKWLAQHGLQGAE